MNKSTNVVDRRGRKRSEIPRLQAEKKIERRVARVRRRRQPSGRSAATDCRGRGAKAGAEQGEEEENPIWLVKTQKYLLYYDKHNILATEEKEELTAHQINAFLVKKEGLQLRAAKEDHLTLVKDILMASFIEAKNHIIKALEQNNRSEIRMFPTKKT